jgi:hypothetical protein
VFASFLDGLGDRLRALRAEALDLLSERVERFVDGVSEVTPCLDIGLDVALGGGEVGAVRKK